MADAADDVRVPRKVFNAFVAGLIGLAYWFLQQGWEKMVAIDTHLVSSDGREYALEQRVEHLAQDLATVKDPKPEH